MEKSFVYIRICQLLLIDQAFLSYEGLLASIFLTKKVEQENVGVQLLRA